MNHSGSSAQRARGRSEGTAMNKDDMILISVDDHTVEPPDMFKNHLPKKYLDDAPGWCTTRTARTPGSSATR
ncbi:amidohydrolase 2 domain protein [Mycobacterium xenopi 3993]|nr:amidohydrolase 2 domain protein [Mycobacterium xenopi 3993]